MTSWLLRKRLWDTNNLEADKVLWEVPPLPACARVPHEQWGLPRTGQGLTVRACPTTLAKEQSGSGAAEAAPALDTGTSWGWAGNVRPAGAFSMQTACLALTCLVTCKTWHLWVTELAVAGGRTLLWVCLRTGQVEPILFFWLEVGQH